MHVLAPVTVPVESKMPISSSDLLGVAMTVREGAQLPWARASLAALLKMIPSAQRRDAAEHKHSRS
jgi:hypothetical protein